jgi:hypothetical protein
MMLGVVLCRLLGMMGGMQPMRMRHVGVMTGLLMIAAFIMLGGLTMMVRGVLVMLGRILVMLAARVRLRAHVIHPVVGKWRREADRNDTDLTPT